ncbi:hypothetical protein I6H48_03495 [Corynebacterium amycolatum]|uniref:Transposase n=1 Tax=Corynebacterium amycolatum TaxID=43765 RepID=A0AB37GJM6_CORAY|nr:hypothetical protein [Corynebacterium amycolatum]QPR31421.1 hypothetical protein I6G95_02910 [Corynebacterium amycolatum]QQB83301.1 hypothetical protein I6H48_03495 [Corynebacterium amycolatum]QQV00870.1 hypothetical protein I6I64_05220 [Corynebacterium amycolatum]
MSGSVKTNTEFCVFVLDEEKIRPWATRVHPDALEDGAVWEVLAVL